MPFEIPPMSQSPRPSEGGESGEEKKKKHRRKAFESNPIKKSVSLKSIAKNPHLDPFRETKENEDDRIAAEHAAKVVKEGGTLVIPKTVKNMPQQSSGEIRPDSAEHLQKHHGGEHDIEELEALIRQRQEEEKQKKEEKGE